MDQKKSGKTWVTKGNQLSKGNYITTGPSPQAHRAHVEPAVWHPLHYRRTPPTYRPIAQDILRTARHLANGDFGTLLSLAHYPELSITMGHLGIHARVCRRKGDHLSLRRALRTMRYLNQWATHEGA